jgi:hypothetical protein
MTIRKTVFREPPVGGDLTWFGTRWHDGWSWHITRPASADEPVDCFEVHWDEDGQGHVTGRRAVGTRAWCAETQRVEDPPRRHEPVDDRYEESA